MPGRKGLIKKRITVMRKGRPIETTVWVRPAEHAAAQRIKREREATGADLVRLQKAKAKAGLTKIPGIGGLGGSKGSKLKGISKSKPKDVSETYGAGATEVSYTDTATGGKVKLLIRSNGVASTLALNVGPLNRGKGAGTRLMAAALSEHPKLQGQIQSKAAATIAHRQGRRPYGKPDASLEDVFEMIDEDSSVNMLTPSLQDKPETEWQKPKNARERVERREKVMTKWRRLAPGKGVETRPTKNEVKDILEVGRFALISAGANPKTEKDMTPEQVAERHKKLRARLIEDGFQFTEVEGKYGEEEDSYLVWIHDADRETAINFGKEYNQESIIFGENGTYEAHYTTGDRTGDMEEIRETWKDQTGEPDYYTKVPLADGSFFKFQLPLYQDRGKESRPKKGSRREYLYGVDDVEQEEVLSRLREARKKKAS